MKRTSSRRHAAAKSDEKKSAAAWRRDEVRFIAVRRGWTEGDRPLTLRRAEFGGWLRIGQALAKATRRLESGASGTEEVANLFSPLSSRLVVALSSKRLWAILDHAREIRNDGAHGGIEAEQTRLGRLVALEKNLTDLRAALGPARREGP